MSAWFEIDTMQADRLLLLRMGGFFDLAAIERMRSEIVEALSTLRCGPNRHLTLCDISGMNIQSQDMVDQFALLVGHPSIRSRRLAFVTSATLARLQARRLTSREGVAFFTAETPALAWLRDDGDGAADTAWPRSRTVAADPAPSSGASRFPPPSRQSGDRPSGPAA